MVAVDTCSLYVRVNKKNGNQELSHIFVNLVIRGPGSGARGLGLLSRQCVQSPDIYIPMLLDR